MKHNHFLIKGAAFTLFTSLFMSTLCMANTVQAKDIELGKSLAFDRKKGNCLACHMIEGGELAGNIGPPLIVMKARFPDRETLRAKIWDASNSNEQSVMPPFGKNRILTETEIEHIINYLYSL